MNPNPDKRKNGSRAGRGPARPQVGLDDPAPTHSTHSRRKRALLVKSGAEQQFRFRLFVPALLQLFPKGNHTIRKRPDEAFAPSPGGGTETGDQ
jgi:hypothetical protein